MTPETRRAGDVLDRQFLLVRAKILEIAAALDRIDRAEGSVEGDRRVELIRSGIAELQSEGPGRAERIQLLFSLPYDETWRDR